MESGGARPHAFAAGLTTAVMLVWLVLAFFWIGALVLIGDRVHPAVGPLWLASDVLLAVPVGWWMLRVRREPRTVVALACWWLVASLAGPASLLLVLPWARGFRARSIGWIAAGMTGHDASRRLRRGTFALLWHALAAFSWLVACGGFLAALSLPNDSPVSPSTLGLVLFAAVPGALWAVAAAVILWRLRAPGRSSTEAALPASGAWWGVSAISAFAIVFSV
jgi:hypothetical protein